MKEIAAAMVTLPQAVITAIQRTETDGEDYALSLPGGEVILHPGDCQISSEDMPGWLVASQGALTVALDVELTPELRQEGLARELVNRIQNLRKASGFEVTDRIEVVIAPNQALQEALAAFGPYVCNQTLARSIRFEAQPEGAVEVEWETGTLAIAVVKLK